MDALHGSLGPSYVKQLGRSEPWFGIHQDLAHEQSTGIQVSFQMARVFEAAGPNYSFGLRRPSPKMSGAMSRVDIPALPPYSIQGQVNPANLLFLAARIAPEFLAFAAIQSRCSTT
jgi:hypothetical protein